MTEPGPERPLSIVQVVDDLNAGGLERFAIDLGVAHRRAGHASAIVCLGGRGALAGQAEAAGLAVEALEKPSGLSPRACWRLAQALRRRRADVVHSHNPGVHHYAAAAAKLGVRDAVVVNTRHGVSGSSGARYSERYFRQVLRWTDKVVYVSRDSEAYYAGQGIVPRAQGVTIWNGTPLEAFTSAARAPRPHGVALRLVTLGRLVPVKGHATLLTAFARVLGEIPSAELHIHGEGPLRGKLEADIERLGLRGHAFLPGETRNTAGALANGDAFVFSSTSEGLPMVILEAMGAGLPVISTRVGGVPEVAPEGETAWYCEPGNAEALADLILTAAQSGELERRGAQAKARAMATLSIEAAQHNYESLFRQLLGNR